MATKKPGSTPLQTGKDRAIRIPLDYYKSLNGIEKAKLGLTVIACILTVGWLVWGAVAEPGGGSMRYSRGPVSSAHEKMDSDCMQCHTAFSPISEQNLFMSHPATAD